MLTGEAAVTLGAAGQGMVAGDLVNTASRLQAVAPPGAVLVGEATYARRRRAIAFEPVGDQMLKGKVGAGARLAGDCASSRKRGGAGRSDVPRAAVRRP